MKMKRWMELRLLSDLCVSNGENYSAWIDNDICYDDYGLPIILAKRLKGCIREVALELADWNTYVELDQKKILITETQVNRIFGTGGSENGIIKLSNAVLENYNSYIQEIETSSYKEYLSFQNVLNQFTYVRAQTAIDSRTGVAKPETLRFTRVAKKGLRFRFSYELDDPLEAAIFELAAKALKQIGLNRNRGMGRIQINSMKESECEKQQRKQEYYLKQIEQVKKDLEAIGSERAKIQYFLWADTKLLFPQSSNRVTETYVPGTNLMGFLSWEYQKQGGMDFSLFQNGRVQFKNAYISDGSHRFRPACAGYFVDKDLESSVCYNYIKEPEQEVVPETKNNILVKRVSLAGAYVYNSFENGRETEELQVISTDTEWNSHIRRNGERALYQFSSIQDRQCFAGEIVGEAEDLKKIVELFPNDGIFRLGRSSSTQYGSLSMLNIHVERYKKKESTLSRKFMLEFVSPVLLFNKKTLTIQATESLLKQELAHCLGIQPDEIEISKQGYLYRTYGGFNRKWQMNKMQVQAFDKGTSLLIELKNPISLDWLNTQMIGERTTEGFGELYAVDYEQMRSQYKKKLSSGRKSMAEKRQLQGVELSQGKKDELISQIAKRLIKEQLILNAMQRANKHKLTNATTIGKLDLLLDQCNTWQEFLQQILWIKDKEKRNDALKTFGCSWTEQKETEEFQKEFEEFLNNARKQACIGQLETFGKEIQLDEVYQIYLSAYLRQAKYEERRKAKG